MTPEQLRRVDEVREIGARLLYEHHHPRIFVTFEELASKYPSSAEGIRQEVDKFLNLKDKDGSPLIYIADADQSKPENPYTTEYKYGCSMDAGMPQGLVVNDDGYVAYAEAQQDMANFRKVIEQ